jgi:hypothetical protein
VFKGLHAQQSHQARGSDGLEERVVLKRALVPRHPVARRAIGISVLTLLLLSCGAPRPRQDAPGSDHGADHGPTRAAVAPAGSGAHVYRIDADRSELRLLVYRAGPMARFGHNHVLINRALDGTVTLGLPRAASSFSFTVPVADFVVDEPQSREQEGADFPGEIPDDARAGTLRNMQSPALLDAAEFPVITVDSVAVVEAPAGMIATLAIKVAGHESRIDAPFALDGQAQDGDAHTLVASGSMDLTQTALGLKPFSILLGALQVEDSMRLKFKITAVEP